MKMRMMLNLAMIFRLKRTKTRSEYSRASLKLHPRFSHHQFLGFRVTILLDHYSVDMFEIVAFALNAGVLGAMTLSIALRGFARAPS